MKVYKLVCVFLACLFVLSCEQKNSSLPEGDYSEPQIKPDLAGYFDLSHEEQAQQPFTLASPEQLSILLRKTYFNDAGLLLPFSAQVSGEASERIVASHWQQIDGAPSVILNPQLPQTYVLLPEHETEQVLHFRFSVLTSDNLVSSQVVTVKTQAAPGVLKLNKSQWSEASGDVSLSLDLSHLLQTRFKNTDTKTLQIRSINGSAEVGSDFMPVDLQVDISASPVVDVPLQLIDDTNIEGSEYFYLLVSGRDEQGDFNSRVALVIRDSASSPLLNQSPKVFTNNIDLSKLGGQAGDYRINLGWDNHYSQLDIEVDNGCVQTEPGLQIAVECQSWIAESGSSANLELNSRWINILLPTKPSQAVNARLQHQSGPPTNYRLTVVIGDKQFQYSGRIGEGYNLPLTSLNLPEEAGQSSSYSSAFSSSSAVVSSSSTSSSASSHAAEASSSSSLNQFELDINAYKFPKKRISVTGPCGVMIKPDGKPMNLNCLFDFGEIENELVSIASWHYGIRMLDEFGTISQYTASGIFNSWTKAPLNFEFATLNEVGIADYAVTTSGDIVDWGQFEPNESINTETPAKYELGNVIAVWSWNKYLTSEGELFSFDFENGKPGELIETDLVSYSKAGNAEVFLYRDGSVKGGLTCCENESSLPRPVSLPNIKQVSAYNHILVLSESGEVYSWGDNSYGQASLPDWLPPLVEISAGETVSAGLTEDGRLVTWGSSGIPVVEITKNKFVAKGRDYWVAQKMDGHLEIILAKPHIVIDEKFNRGLSEISEVKSFYFNQCGTSDYGLVQLMNNELKINGDPPIDLEESILNFSELKYAQLCEEKALLLNADGNFKLHGFDELLEAEIHGYGMPEQILFDDSQILALFEGGKLALFNSTLDASLLDNLTGQSVQSIQGSSGRFALLTKEGLPLVWDKDGLMDNLTVDLPLPITRIELNSKHFVAVDANNRIIVRDLFGNTDYDFIRNDLNQFFDGYILRNDGAIFNDLYKEELHEYLYIPE